MTGIEHEADGSWLVPLLLLAALCWQFWVSLRYTKPPDGDAEADNKPAPARPFAVDLGAFYRSRQPAEAAAHADAPPGDPRFADAVGTIRTYLHDFDLTQFLARSQAAYETIVTAFARGDATALQPLLTPEVYATYAAAITERASDDKPTRTALVRLAEPELLDVAVQGHDAVIRVRFDATWLHVRAADNEATSSGGIAVADAARDTTDEWTFARSLDARDPIWRLAASN